MKSKIAKALLAAGTAACTIAGYTACSRKKTVPGNAQEKDGSEAPLKNDISAEKNVMTEERARRCLLNLFWMYDYEEFWHFDDYGMDDRDLRDCAAGFYAPVLYRFMKQHMKITYKMDGDDGTGHEPFEMSDRLFYVPACMICSRPEEMVSDRFGILLKKEVWILEDGRAASVYCMNFEKDGWKAVYRFLDKYIRDPGDMPVPFEELEEGLVHMMQAVEGDENKNVL